MVSPPHIENREDVQDTTADTISNSDDPDENGQQVQEKRDGKVAQLIAKKNTT